MEVEEIKTELPEEGGGNGVDNVVIVKTDINDMINIFTRLMVKILN